MVPAIQLTVLTGPHKNRRFRIFGPTRCQVGRAPDCLVQFAGHDRDGLISRHHCRLDIDPPAVSVHDLGSANGTYLNGKRVASTTKEPSEEVGSPVKGGDLLTVGGTTLQVDIVDCLETQNDSNVEVIWPKQATAKKECPWPR
jgi:pSer/pThr/pTyr-binding forkhead associated (FHA) protein